MVRRRTNDKDFILAECGLYEAREIITSPGSKVVNLVRRREGRTMALEVGFDEIGLALVKELADHDPCHALYVVAENVVSPMTESISGMREAKGYLRIAGGAEDECVPDGLPMSPLAVSYFTADVLRAIVWLTGNRSVRLVSDDEVVSVTAYMEPFDVRLNGATWAVLS